MPASLPSARRRARLTIATVLASALLVACGAPKVGMLRVTGAPPAALVTIDDVYVGKLERLGKLGVRLPVGERRVTIEATGYLPHDVLVHIEQDQTSDLAVELVEEPD